MGLRYDLEMLLLDHVQVSALLEIRFFSMIFPVDHDEYFTGILWNLGCLPKQPTLQYL